MKENDSNWFSWEDELPLPEDLIPLSQSLITPDLALAFNIPTPHAPPNSSAEHDSTEPGGGGSDDTARTLKRPRLVWTPHLHKRFVDAVAHLGIKNAVPKTIMQIMNVEGLTRENVASHLQKYRLYLKRVQSISSSGGREASGIDSATDRLFASSPVPAHFLHPGRADSVNFLPFVPTSAMNHHQHHPQQQNGQLEHAFMRQRMGTTIHNSSSNGSIVVPSYAEDVELPNGKKVLTLFPTGDD